MKKKHTVIAVLAGWLLAMVLPPSTVFGKLRRQQG